MAARVRSISKVLKADTNTNRVIGFSSSEYLTNGHPETTTTGFNLVPGVEVLSNLPLQMCLHFNAYYSIIWILSLIIGLEVKFSFLLSHYKYATVVIYIIMFALEISRLYLGYEGNLREKVAELAGFWLLSILQLILVIYLMVNISTVILPIEYAVNVPLALFLVIQLVTGFRALQLFIRSQVVKYHVSLLNLQPKLGQGGVEEID